MLLVTMERLKDPGEYYCTLLGGTSKNKKDIRESTSRELCEETRGFMQIDKSKLIEYMSFTDKDKCTIYLLPLSNNYKLIHEINSFRNGVIMPPECSESSFVIALTLTELLSWVSNTSPSSPPYYYFKKPYINKCPLVNYKKFINFFDKSNDYLVINPMSDFQLSTHSTRSSGSTRSTRSSRLSRSIRSSCLSENDSSDSFSLFEPSNSLSNSSDFLHGVCIEPRNEFGISKTVSIPIPQTNLRRSRSNEECQPSIWIGERLARVLREIDESALIDEYYKKAFHYKYVDRGICFCEEKRTYPKKGEDQNVSK